MVHTHNKRVKLKSLAVLAIISACVGALSGCGGSGSSTPVQYVVGALQIGSYEGFTGTTGAFTVNNGTATALPSGSKFTLAQGDRTFEIGVPTTRPVVGQLFPITRNESVQGIWATLTEGTPPKNWETRGGVAGVETNVDQELVVNVITMVFDNPSNTSIGQGSASGTVTAPSIKPLKSAATATAGLLFKTDALSSSSPSEVSVTSGSGVFTPAGIEYRCFLADGSKIVVTDSSGSSASTFDLASTGYKCEYFAPGSTTPIVATAGRGFQVSVNSTLRISLVGVVFPSGSLTGTLDGWFNYAFA